VGYHPDQEKIAVIELNQNDTPLKTASLVQVTEDGKQYKKLIADVNNWGHYLRYNYVTFDFSPVKETGLYRIQYGDQQTKAFPIATNVYEKTWHQTLDVWFPVQMDHMFVNEAYRVWHGAAHLDDALQAPVNHQHFDGYKMGPFTDTDYQPGERIPGLNIGGWFDAGDFDIRTGSHCNTVLILSETWEHFGIKRDETLIDQDQRYADIHHPDGKPDLLQQVEHGVLALIAQHRAFGRAIPGIIVPELHQYHHLGDGSTMTDNLNYNPDLQEYESNGFESGTKDDRWAFTNKSSYHNYASIGALSAASRVLRGYNDTLADECLAAAKKAWKNELLEPVLEDEGRFQWFRKSAELSAALQLFITTKDSQYYASLDTLLWPALDKFLGWNIIIAARALPHLDDTFKNRLEPYVHQFKRDNENFYQHNPFGVLIGTRSWAGSPELMVWAITNYLLHQEYPDIIGPEYTIRGLNYLFGCHPGSNISFVSGVGVQSKKVAYGNNRADYSFIAGGVVPGTLILKPDFPENKEDWPFIWGENEYVIDACASYIFLANAVIDLLNEIK
jgi:endoglucanase